MFYVVAAACHIFAVAMARYGSCIRHVYDMLDSAYITALHYAMAHCATPYAIDAIRHATSVATLRC